MTIWFCDQCGNFGSGHVPYFYGKNTVKLPVTFTAHISIHIAARYFARCEKYIAASYRHYKRAAGEMAGWGIRGGRENRIFSFARVYRSANAARRGRRGGKGKEKFHHAQIRFASLVHKDTCKYVWRSLSNFIYRQYLY